MACTLATIPKKTCNTNNIPGIRELYAIPVDDVIDMAAVSKAIAAFTFAVGKAFVKVNFTPGSGLLNSGKNSETVDSDSFSGSIQVFIPEMNASRHQLLEQYGGVDMIMVAVDGNGVNQVLGSSSSPVRFTLSEGGSGTSEQGQRNGHLCTFTQILPDGYPNEYTGTIAALLVPGA